MIELKSAMDIMEKEGYTLVMYKENDIITSRKRGVAPLIDLLNSDKDYKQYSALDKVVGKGAAFLYILLGVTHVYAYTISKSALGLMQNRGISVKYSQLTERINNRDNTGFCPVETAVIDTIDEKSAYNIIIDTLKNLGA